VMKRNQLMTRGLPSVLSQTFRTMIHSRLTVGLAAYDERYSDAEVVLIEPRRDDYRMFFNNIFSFASRKSVCEYAYRATRRDLRERRAKLAPIFARHGIRLRDEILDDEKRDMWFHVGLGPGGLPQTHREAPATVERLDQLLDRLDTFIEAD